MTEQLELNFGDEGSVLYAMDKRQLIARVQEMEVLYFSKLRGLVLQGEINRAVMQAWKLLNKDGTIGADTLSDVFHTIEYAVQKIEEQKT